MTCESSQIIGFRFTFHFSSWPSHYSVTANHKQSGFSKQLCNKYSKNRNNAKIFADKNRKTSKFNKTANDKVIRQKRGHVITGLWSVNNWMAP